MQTMRDLTHWRDYVPSDLNAKNAEALAAYRQRAANAGEYRDPLKHANRVLSGFAARRWINWEQQ